MIPATYNFSVVRGSAGPTQGLRVRLKARLDENTLENIPFEDIRLSIYQRNVKILRATLANGQMVVSDPSEAEVTWQPTAAETRLIPVGTKARYELEIRQGTNESIYMMGTLTGIGGINDDIGDADDEDDAS
jgi:hypothetical protein